MKKIFGLMAFGVLVIAGSAKAAQNYPCEAKVNGVVVRSVMASSVETCYSQIAYGAANCSKYSRFLKRGKNLLSQVFNHTVSVSSEICVK